MLGFNEGLWFVVLLINFLMIIGAYRLFGKIGLYVWTAIAIILANIQVLKTVELFGLVTTSGNIIYSTAFLATDILSENHSRRDANLSVMIGFFSILSMTVIMWLTVNFIPHESDFIQESLKSIFTVVPRIAIASLLAYLSSQLHDVWAYHFWKGKFKSIWIRNNLSTMISQLLDSVIFTFVAFWGVYSGEILRDIIISTYLLKFIVAFCDTPFIYISTKFKKVGVFVPAAT